MGDADLLAGLHRVLGQELLEEPDPLGELARVLGEGIHLDAEMLADVLDVVRLVRPAEPDVGHLLDLETFPQMLRVEVRVARTREHRVERDEPGGAMVGVVVVAVLEEDQRRVAGQERFGSDLADTPGHGLADVVGVLQLAVVDAEDPDARQPEDLARGHRLGVADAREVLTILRGVARAAVAVRQHQQMDLAAGGAPLRDRAADRDLRVVGMGEDREYRAGARLG